MKKLAIAIMTAAMLVLLLAIPVYADKPAAIDSQGNETAWVHSNGATIQGGTILYSAGHFLTGPLTVGFDIFGYNYQGHMFDGSYFNAYAGGAGFPPWDGDDTSYLSENPEAAGHWAWVYRDVRVQMKWNDAWLANTDGDDPDAALDRHAGFSSYIGSGAWETNHQWGTNPDGTKWDYFVKIVAVPTDASLVSGIWYTPDGSEIGSDVWGEFAVIQEVYNDQSTGDHGILYLSPTSAGFGYYAP